MLTDGSEKEPITGAFFVRAWIQSLRTTEDVLTLLQATWVGGLVSHGQGVCVCVCIWLSDISSASHVIPLSVLETRASERAGECVNVSLREVWMWGATCNARLLCLVVSSLCVCLLLFTRVHVQTRTDTHANFTSLQPFLPRAFISNSFPSISTINHSSLSTNAAITPKDDERERCIQK